MTIIDALIVELGLDASQLAAKAPVATAALKKLEDQGEKTEKTTKKVEKSSKDAAHSLENLSRTVASFLAIIGGTVAIKNFISDFIESNAQLDRFSKNIGLSVSTISAWSNASEKLGGSAQGLQGTLDMLSKSQTQLMITGESGILPYMSALGISLADVNGKARPVTDVLLDLSDRFANLDRTTANNLGRMIGLDQGTLNLLLQGRKELELEISRQKEQTAVTKQQADEAQKLQTQIVGIKQQFGALGRTLLMDAIPYIEKLLDLFERFSQWAQTHQQFIGDFLKVIAVGLAAIALITAPINLTVLAVVALAGAIALLWEDYQVWKKGGDSLIDWGLWQSGIEAAKNGINTLVDSLKALWAWFEKIKNSPLALALNTVLGSPGTSVGNAITKSVTGIVKKTGLAQSESNRLDPKEIKAFFESQGWTPAQASGITANLISESGGNPNASGDRGTAFGLGQWRGDRQAAFKKLFGHDIHESNFAEQLAFTQFELTQGSKKGVGDQLSQINDASQAGSLLSRKFEIPKDADGEASRRGALAQSLLQSSGYASSVAGVPGAASVVSNAPGAPGGSQSTVDKSVQTTIGSITVNTQATDADGIASDLEHSMDYLFASQVNSGLN